MVSSFEGLKQHWIDREESSCARRGTTTHSARFGTFWQHGRCHDAGKHNRAHRFPSTMLPNHLAQTKPFDLAPSPSPTRSLPCDSRSLKILNGGQFLNRIIQGTNPGQTGIHYLGTEWRPGTHDSSLDLCFLPQLSSQKISDWNWNDPLIILNNSPKLPYRIESKCGQYTAYDWK